MTCHGGIVKTPGVAQRYLAAACNASITCMETAGEGGPYGIALPAEVEGFARYLAAYDKGLDVERTAVEKI